MRCLITNCLHITKSIPPKKTSSWSKYQICGCCATNLYYENNKDSAFRIFRKPLVRKCRNRDSFSIVKDQRETRLRMLKAIVENPGLKTKEIIMKAKKILIISQGTYVNEWSRIRTLNRYGFIIRKGHNWYATKKGMDQVMEIKN